MKAKVKFIMEDLRHYEETYNVPDNDLITFANDLTECRKKFPFIQGYTIETIEEVDNAISTTFTS